jgi:DNA-binding NarL/FixJ family response regulator
MVLLAQGFSNKEIAHAIGIAEGTVKCHIDAVRGKAGFRRRIELATWFIGYKVRSVSLHHYQTGRT